MAGRSMADNHLSKLASKGRYGDTEIVKSKFVKPGASWHVTKGEEATMSLYGSVGERMVDDVGSGTINPETGLEEKFLPAVMATPMFWTAAAAVGSAVIGGISAISGAKAEKTQARYEEKAATQGLEKLEEAESGLESAVSKKREAGMLDYRTDIENISAQTGMKKEDLSAQTSQAVQQSGLATSGTIGAKRSQMWNRIQGSFERGQEGLLGTLGKKMGEVEGWYEGEKARIASERIKLERQQGLAKEQQKGLFG